MGLRPPDPPLQDGTILLRPWRDDDATAIARACNDPEMQRWLPLPSPYTEADARAYLDRVGAAWAEGTRAAFAIADLTDGRLLGAIGLHLKPARVAAIGYWAAPEARGRGYTTRALRLLARWGFEELQLARVQLTTDPHNVASQRVAERAGFRREARLRSFLELNGVRSDAFMYSLLPSDLGPAV